MKKTEKNVIDDWIDKTSNRKLLLVIGAGFSKNALNKETGE